MFTTRIITHLLPSKRIRITSGLWLTIMPNMNGTLILGPVTLQWLQLISKVCLSGLQNQTRKRCRKKAMMSRTMIVLAAHHLLRRLHPHRFTWLVVKVPSTISPRRWVTRAGQLMAVPTAERTVHRRTAAMFRTTRSAMTMGMSTMYTRMAGLKSRIKIAPCGEEYDYEKN